MSVSWRSAVAVGLAMVASLGVAVTSVPAKAAPSSVLDELLPANEPNPIDEIQKLLKPSADPSLKPNLLNHRPTPIDSTDLNVTVGRAVVVSSNPDGSSAGLTALVSKTQVSGTGRRVVQVPMATENPSNSDGFSDLNVDGTNIIYDVRNSGSSIQTFNAGNGSYQNSLPVSVKVQAWLDAKEIDPSELVNVTGNVRVSYTFTNLTGVPTELSYRNAAGDKVTATESIPVPFGGSFAITLPSSFADVNAPWATGAMSPSGLVMSGSVNLFGPIPVIGGNSQTLTFDARAQNATLPAATYQAVPVTLSQTEADLALQAGPVATQLTQVADRAIGWADNEILKYHALFTKYVAAAESINTRYVRPILRGFANGTYERMLNDGLDQIRELDSGAQQLGQLLPVATEVIGYVDTALKTGVPILEENLDTLDEVVKIYEEYLPKIEALVPQIQQTLIWMDDNLEGYVAKGVELAQTAKNICGTVQQIDQEIDAMMKWIEDTFPAWLVTPLKEYLEGVISQFNTIEGYVDQCVTLAPTVLETLKTAQAELPKYLGYASQALKLLKQALALAEEYDPLLKDVVEHQDEYLKKLDNNKCPKTNDGIVKCGYKQQITYLYGLMNQAVDGVQNGMVPGLDTVVQQYLPVVQRYFRMGQAKVNRYGPQLEALLPSVIGYVEDTFGTIEGYTGKAADYTAKAGDVIGRTVAAMEAMEERGRSGAGQPAGANAVGADTNLAVYQFSLAPAADLESQNVQMLALAFISALVALGLGTFLHRRSRE